MLLNKIDLLPHLDFDVERCIDYARRVNPASRCCRSRPPAARAWTPGWPGCERGVARGARSSGWTRSRRCSRRVAELEAQLAAAAAAADRRSQRWPRPAAVESPRDPRARHRAGRGLPALRLPPGAANSASPAGCATTREGVTIEVAGRGRRRCGAVRARLRDEAPPLARVDAVEATPRRAGAPTRAASRSSTAARRRGDDRRSPPDTAICADCLAELFDPADRR